MTTPLLSRPLPPRLLARPRLFLVGFMAAGKTTVGRALARELSFEFVDLDREIERDQQRTIGAIFAEDGEAAFRRLESAALERACGRARLVVATGGGAFVAEGNVARIAGSGISVWLDLPWELALERLGRSTTRPLFSDREAAHRLYLERLPHYRRAELRVAVGSNDTPRRLAHRIVSMVEALA